LTGTRHDVTGRKKIIYWDYSALGLADPWRSLLRAGEILAIV